MIRGRVWPVLRILKGRWGGTRHQTGVAFSGESDALRFKCHKCPIETKCFPQAEKMEFHQCPNETKCFSEATRRATEKGQGQGHTEGKVCIDVGEWSTYVEKFNKIEPEVYGAEESMKLCEIAIAEAIKNCGIEQWDTCCG
ncbi:hypothetical protein MKW98_016288 [Papaver atlanticum]|uniref:Uncharacterized protein n=1 Tax=Papaver atlanticum TaxID=357466 RepID=A0AAD4SID6_9MAGN|nr:hypothetical protein MKW98_016288 [Papaver atlanticum]